jgi:hypothetical protein
LRFILVVILASLPCWTQTTSPEKVTANAPCSIANSGTGNKIQISCGIGREQGQKILTLLNKILADQVDLNVIAAKLDELSQSNNSSGILLSALSSSNPRLEIGDSGSGFEWSGIGPMALNFFEDTSLVVEKVANHIAVSTKIRDGTGKMVAEIERNEWKLRPSLLWDRNYTSNSLEILDETGDVVLQIVVLSDRIQIQGIWHDKTGQWLEMVKERDGRGHFVGSIRKGPESEPVKISPIFVYPSDRHFGELQKP